MLNNTTPTTNLLEKENIIFDLTKKPFFTIIVNKKEDLPKYSSPEETMIDLIFKNYSIKHKKIEYFQEDFCLFFGKLPVIYTLNTIINNKNIPFFLIELIFQETPVEFLEFMENLLYILQDVYKISYEFLIFHKNKEKFSEKKKSFFMKIKNFFFQNSSFEKNFKNMFDNLSYFSDVEKHDLPIDEKAKAIIRYSYQIIADMYYKEINSYNTNKENKEIKKKEMIINLFIYAYIKEELENSYFNSIFSENDLVTKLKRDIIRYIDKEFNSRVNNLRLDIGNRVEYKISESTLERIKNQNCFKNLKIDKEKDLIENQLAMNFKNHLIVIGIFVGSALFFYILSRKDKKNTIADQLGTEMRIIEKEITGFIPKLSDLL